MCPASTITPEVKLTHIHNNNGSLQNLVFGSIFPFFPLNLYLDYARVWHQSSCFSLPHSTCNLADCFAFPRHGYPTESAPLWSVQQCVCLLSCARSIPAGFHLLAPSKALHTGGVIAQLTAGEGVEDSGERTSSMKRMQVHGGLEWPFGCHAFKTD